MSKKTITQINTRSHKRRDLWQFVAIGVGVVFLATLPLSNSLVFAAFAASAACVWAAYRKY